ncbi:hypothetical protein [Micromonospora sp. NPDC004704]
MGRRPGQRGRATPEVVGLSAESAGTIALAVQVPIYEVTADIPNPDQVFLRLAVTR